MATRLTISADERAMHLHGPSDAQFEGDVRTATATAAPDACPADVVVKFDDGGVSRPAIQWFGGSPPAAQEQDHRLIATRGDALWRREPLPVADAVWELAPPDSKTVLLVGSPGEDRDRAEGKLRDRLLSVRAVPALSLSGLRECGVVALHGPPGEPLHGAAFAALAAARPLIAPASDPAFGLLAGVDHLSHNNDDELAIAANTALAFPRALEPIVAMGLLAAETRRASAVYARLLADLRLGLL